MWCVFLKIEPPGVAFDYILGGAYVSRSNPACFACHNMFPMYWWVGGGVHRKSSFSKSQELYSVWCVFLKIVPPGFAVIIMFCFTVVLACTCHSRISCGCTISRRPKFCATHTHTHTHTHEACQLQALEAPLC